MILTVREIGADQDGGLSPIPSEHGKSENWSIDSDSYDGGAPLVLPIVGLHEQEVVSGRARSLSKLPGIKGTMYITDSRAAVAVEKFTKGRQYSGIFEVTESVALVAVRNKRDSCCSAQEGQAPCGPGSLPVAEVRRGQPSAWPRP
jgi:hypothetical protein